MLRPSALPPLTMILILSKYYFAAAHDNNFLKAMWHDSVADHDGLRSALA
jgi:hypothetical protein